VERIGSPHVSAAISVYLLLGFLLAHAYQILVALQPGAIYFQPQAGGAIGPAELLYFSFVTLAKVGYGDAYPVSSPARALCVLESLGGVLYVPVLRPRYGAR